MHWCYSVLYQGHFAASSLVESFEEWHSAAERTWGEAIKIFQRAYNMSRYSWYTYYNIHSTFIQHSRYFNIHTYFTIFIQYFNNLRFNNLQQQQYTHICVFEPCSYLFASSEIMKCRLLKWLLDHPVNFRRPPKPRQALSSLSLSMHIYIYIYIYDGCQQKPCTSFL